MSKKRSASKGRRLGGAEVAARNASATFQPSKSQRAQFAKSRRASKQIVTSGLRSAGVDIKQIKALEAQRSADLRHMVQSHKLAALRRAKRFKATVQSSALANAKKLAALSARGNFFQHPTFTLDTPELFWTLSDRFINDTATAPFDSWIKFYYSDVGDFNDSNSLGFRFNWANPFTDFVIVNAVTSLVATGYIEASAKWEIFGSNSASATTLASFNQWVGTPTTVTPTNILGSVSAHGNIWGGNVSGCAIAANLGLYTPSPILVAPGAVATFEVALQCRSTGNDDYSIREFDFASGDFRVWCPLVVVWTMNLPPWVVAGEPLSRSHRKRR